MPVIHTIKCIPLVLIQTKSIVRKSVLCGLFRSWKSEHLRLTSSRLRQLGFCRRRTDGTTYCPSAQCNFSNGQNWFINLEGLCLIACLGNIHLVIITGIFSSRNSNFMKSTSILDLYFIHNIMYKTTILPMTRYTVVDSYCKIWQILTSPFIKICLTIQLNPIHSTL